MSNHKNAFNNVHPADSVCLDTPWIGFPQNWGSPIGPVFTVRLDPVVNTRRDSAGAARREPSFDDMVQLIDEFAGWNDDVLRELAR